MEIYDIFTLRRQRRIEEAYAAIRPIYKNYHGKHTTICMFLVGIDMFYLTMEKGDFAESHKILQACLNVYLTRPQDIDTGANALLKASLFMYRFKPDFDVFNFVLRLDINRCTGNMWLPATHHGEPYPSIAEQVITACYGRLEDEPTVDVAHAFLPLLQAQITHWPNARNTYLYRARILEILGDTDKAKELRSLVDTKMKNT